MSENSIYKTIVFKIRSWKIQVIIKNCLEWIKKFNFSSFWRSLKTKNPINKISNRPLRWFLYGFIGLIFLFGAIDLNLFWLFGYSPSFHDIKNPEYSVASEIYSADGKLIGKFYRENRSPVSFEDLPKNLINALISTEDIRFYQHGGIDFFSFFSSIWSTAKGDKRGGSTITQQLAKNLYETRKKKSAGVLGNIPGLRTTIYKMKEWIITLKIERIYSKNQILALYLNTVGFGNNTFGIKVAARRYFNKKPGELSTEESALLVGMLKAPSTYNPITNPLKALNRRNTVLGQMVKNHFLSNEDYKDFIKDPIHLQPGEMNQKEEESYIRSAVESFVKAWAHKNGYDIYSDGLKIYTSIDSRMQNYAEEAVDEKMKILQNRLNGQMKDQDPWVDENGNDIKDFLSNLLQRLPEYEKLKQKYKNPDSLNSALNTPHRMKVFTWKGEKDTSFSILDSLGYYAKILQTGLLSYDPHTGYIKAWVGGINDHYFHFDHVMQSKRQPGSTFKPFVYLAAIDNGYSPCDKITDKAVTISYKDVTDGVEKTWSPKNADWKFSGRDMSLRWALGKSCNSVTAQLTDKIGSDKVVKYAHLLGIHSDLKPVPSIGLGPFDVSLYDMVGAYGTFLNNGYLTKPQLITKIVDKEGTLIDEFNPEPVKVISDETAWLMLYMLQGGIQEPGGTSQALWEYDLWKNGNEIAGKTGTSSNYSDAWYIGITKDLVTGVWVGAEDRSVHFRTSQSGEGSHTALPIFGAYMERLYHDPKSGIKEGKFPKPKVKIKTKYYCPNFIPKKDTLIADSTQKLISMDSIGSIL
jgi:penicillin-binding protein 1A